MRALLRALTLAAAAALAGCDGDFDPESLVNDFRVLGLRAQPADLRPGETATLEALVADPSRPAQTSLVAWLACDPDPANLERSTCTNTESLKTVLDPFSAAATLPPGIRALGVSGGAPVVYTAPADLYATLPADDPRRQSGSVAQILAYAAAEDPAILNTDEGRSSVAARVQAGTLPAILSLFRIRVSEDPQVNQNPLLGSFAADGVELPSEFIWRLPPGANPVLSLAYPPEAFESYSQATPTGVEAKTERLIAAYYVTEGEFAEDRIASGSDTEQRYLAPQLGEAGAREGRLWVVVRDTRGGATWLERRLFFCDPSLPAPSVTALQGREQGEEQVLSLSGSELIQVLEVTVGGQVLTGLTVTDTQIEGRLPSLPPGDYPVVVRARNCGDVAAPEPYRAP
ncbi:MAG TPA: IPT/TIG domain-containing protein [Myxococcaceae bacterium]|nr:IPT/TIG domain-containing protein [Myxococcaceae bacterium]